MSSLPLVLSLADDLDRLSTAVSPFYYWPSGYQLARPNMSVRNNRPAPLVGKDGFQVSMDVSHFKPSEVCVKVVDNCVMVEGKHEEREDDHGYISRHFVRRYTLPKGYQADKVASTLLSDGVLTVSAPKPSLEDKSNERIIQIQHTGPAHLCVKDNSDEEKKQQQKAKK